MCETEPSVPYPEWTEEHRQTASASANCLLRHARETRVFSGAAWSIGDGRGAQVRGTIGTRSWNGSPIDENSLWDLASVTKPIAALAVMSMVERGQLTLDDTVGEHLPDYRGTDKSAVTVRDLLTHTSGLPGQVKLFRWQLNSDEFLIELRETPLVVPSGVDVIYTSQGFIILGLIAEAASGMTLDQLVSDRVLVPTSMNSTAYGVRPADRHRAVSTEDDPWRGRMICGEVHDENAVVLDRPAAHAGLFSTLGDMELLGQSLCRAGCSTRVQVLSEATFRQMIKPQTDHLNLRRSLGWQGVDAKNSPAGDLISDLGFGHTGFTGTSIWVDPVSSRYAILLTNRVHPTRADDRIARVRRAFNNLAFGG